MLTPTALLAEMDVEILWSLITAEVRQLRQEGFDISSEDIPQTGASSRQLAAYYERLFSAGRVKDYPFEEPETLEDIRRARPEGPRAQKLTLSTAGLLDGILGGWQGRIAGCVLGKPVEPWGYKEKIADYLKLANAYPLDNYIPRLNPFPAEHRLNPGSEGSFLGEIHGAPQDDDTDYTVLGLHMLEARGVELKTSDVANAWLNYLAYERTFTAERAAYRNLILGVPAEQAAKVANPEREYIGARIRVDIYGLVCPGQPELAAGLAYQDAVLSHTRNGVYSAMFTAACIAWAFVTADMEEIIWAGLAEIPSNCRLAEAIRQVVDIYHTTDDWEAAYAQLLPEAAAYHPVHAINNTQWMVLALLYGKGDFEKTICTAVMCGFDTDCNGANVGTILGVILGAGALPARWIDPLEDSLRSAVAQYSHMRITSLANRTARLAEQILSNLSVKGAAE